MDGRPSPTSEPVMQMGDETTRKPGSVIVIGGGVAGLACALRLTEAGVRVTVVEAQDRLGGRAGSTASGHDLGQHVILQCCTNAIDFYTRLGVIDRFAWFDRLYFARPGQREVDVLRASEWLPAPLHFGPALARATFLNVSDKAQLVLGMAAVPGSDSGVESRADEDFGSWLRRHGQGESVIARFWNPVVAGACNLPVDRCSLKMALQIFHRGMLANRDGMVLGIPMCGLGELLGGRDEGNGRWIDPPVVPPGRGRDGWGEGSVFGQVRLGVGVKRVMVVEDEEEGEDRGESVREPARRGEAALTPEPSPRGRGGKSANREIGDPEGSDPSPGCLGPGPGGQGMRVTGVELGNGEVMHADGYVSAVPAHRVEAMFTDGVIRKDERLQAAGRILHSPILGVDVWFDRPVMDLPFLTLVGDSPLHWLFAKDGGRRVHVVVSACDAWMGLSRGGVQRRVLEELKRVRQVQCDQAVVQDVRVTRVNRATIAPVPGIEDGCRPGAGAGAVSNLFVAGDWCDTGGWPSTIEGAVRSGYRAAAAVLGLGPEAMEVPELGDSGVYRWLCGALRGCV